MLRFFYVIIINLWRAFYFIPKMRYEANRPAKYSLEERYALGQTVVRHMQRTARIHTKSYGHENLPQKGGYALFANHQGKYDALGIVNSHKNPLSLVMDEARSHTILVAQFLDLLESKRLVLDDIRQGMQIMKEITREIAEDGKVFLIFPEGGYEKNHNKVCPFKGGSFKCAMKAKAPIVPVAIIDSYKAFEGMSLRKVYTQVHYLKPLFFEDYKHLSTQEVANLVQEKIQKTILDNLSGKDLLDLQLQLGQS